MEESSNQEENNSTNIEEEEDTKDAGGDHSDNMTKVSIQNYPLSLSTDLPFLRLSFTRNLTFKKLVDYIKPFVVTSQTSSSRLGLITLPGTAAKCGKAWQWLVCCSGKCRSDSKHSI